MDLLSLISVCVGLHVCRLQHSCEWPCLHCWWLMERWLLWLRHCQAVAYQHHQPIWHQFQLHAGNMNHTVLWLKLSFPFAIIRSLPLSHYCNLIIFFCQIKNAYCLCQLPTLIKNLLYIPGLLRVSQINSKPALQLCFVCVCSRWGWSSTVTLLVWRFLWGNTRVKQSSSRPYGALNIWEEIHRQGSMLRDYNRFRFACRLKSTCMLVIFAMWGSKKQ